MNEDNRDGELVRDSQKGEDGDTRLHVLLKFSWATSCHMPFAPSKLSCGVAVAALQLGLGKS